MAEPSTRARIGQVALLITAGGLASRLLGLAREQLAAGFFGAGDEIAAFQIADNVGTLLFDLVVSGMLQAALIPVLVEYATKDAREELREVAGTIAVVALGVIGVAVLLGELAAPSLVRVMTTLGADGTARDPATTALTVDLVRIVLPGVLFLALGTIFSAVLYALDRPRGPSAALAGRNAAIVLATLLLADRLGVKSMAVGVLAGGLLVAAIQVPALVRAGAVPKLALNLRHPAVRRIGWLYLPVFAGLIVSTVQVVVDRNLAWRAEEDALGAMRYATTLVQSVLGLVAAAISLAALPTMAGHATRKDEAAYAATLESALRYVAVLMLPAVLGLAAVSRPVVALLFEHGATGPSEAFSITVVLLGYLPGTLFAAFDQVLIYAFYARQSTWTPVLVGVLASGSYFATAGTLADRYGALGLAIANSAQFILHTLVLAYLARRLLARFAGRMGGFLVRCGTAGVLSAAIAGLLVLLVRELDATSLAGEGLAVVLPSAAGGAVYLAMLRYWRVPEAEALMSKVRR